MPNNFCRFLSNGYRIESDGVGLHYSPCCWFNRKIDLLNNPDFDKQKELISQVDHWIPECSTCRQIEESGAYGKISPRLRSFTEIPNNDIPDNVPGWMEITIDTTCNAACVMCGPWHSTTWRKQEVKFGLKTPDDLPDLVDPLKWLDFIKNKFPLDYVKSVSFLGGEPFESPVPLEFLKLLKNTHGTLADVDVHFQTNASLIPNDELMTLASECKRIRFNMSIDATERRLEYLRYPLKWNRITNTIDHVQNLNLPNLQMVVLATINPFNVYYYDELERWVDQTIKSTNKQVLIPNRSFGRVDLSHTPKALRVEIFDKFGPDHTISKLFSTLSVSPHTDYVNYFEWLDEKRKTNWRATFPDIVDYFN
jgi:organic radical activating enzyme